MKVSANLTSGLLIALLAAAPSMAAEPSTQPAAEPAGGQPQEVAKPKATSVYTQLLVCGEKKDGCAKPGARWTGRVTLGLEAKGTPQEFKWNTTVPGVTHGRWEVSPKPYSASPGSVPSVAAKGDAGKPEEGRFTISIGDLSQYYVRVMPMAGDQPAGKYSNIVKVQFKAPQPPKPATDKSAE